MCAAVGGIVELVGPDRVRQFIGQAARDFLVVIRIAVRHGLHAPYFRPERLDQGVFLRRLVIRHYDDAAIAAGITDMRQADAGVARSAFDNGTAALEYP